MRIARIALAGGGKSSFRAVAGMIAFSTLHKSWLLSLIFSPCGRDKREGAGCGSPFFRSLLVGALILGWIVSVAPLVLAHSFPESESPAAGQTLTSSPAEIAVKFDAPVEKLFAKLDVLGPERKNESVTKPEVSSDGYTLSVKVGTLKPGEYTVQWAVTCVDTHHTQGSYTFTVASNGN
jgi:methionine-rich copper-binding protein CopC